MYLHRHREDTIYMHLALRFVYAPPRHIGHS